MKRLLAVTLSGALAGGAPGLPAGEAVAQTVQAAPSLPVVPSVSVSGAALLGGGTSPGAASLAGPALGGPGLQAAVPGLSVHAPAAAAASAAGAAAPAAPAALPSAGAAAPVAALPAVAPLLSPAPLASQRKGQAQYFPKPARSFPFPGLGASPSPVPLRSSGLGEDVRAREDARFDGAAPRAGALDAVAAAFSPAPSPNLLSAATPLSGPAWSGHMPPPPGPASARGPPAAPAAPPSEFRAPASITWSLRAFGAAHLLGLAGSLAAFTLGFGWAALAGAAIVGGGLWWQWRHMPRDDGARAFSDNLTREQRERLEGQAAGIVDWLLGRLGLPQGARPAVELDNRYGAQSAAAEGNGIRAQSRLRVGEGFFGRPPEQLAGVLGHELGHMWFGDFGVGRYLRTWQAMDFGLALLTRMAAWATGLKLLVWSGAAAWDWASSGLPAAMAHLDPLAALTAAAAAGVAYVLAAAGLLAGIAVARQEEFRADRFGAWLTRPEWLVAHFEFMLARQGPATGSRWERLRRRLRSSHPPYEERIERLRASPSAKNADKQRLGEARYNSED